MPRRRRSSGFTRSLHHHVPRARHAPEVCHRGIVMDTMSYMEAKEGTKPRPTPAPGRLGLKRLLPFGLLLVGVLLWEAVIQWGSIPSFLVPPPSRIFSRLLEALGDGSLIRHTLFTFSEIAAGLAIGLSAAMILGYSIAKSKTLEAVLAPYIIASQSVPIVAIAPLLVIWFGPGRISKILICSLIVFFPVLVNTVVGVRSVPSSLYDLMRSLQATRWQMFTKLEAPAAMPILLGGLKIGATLSVIGAVVGEFVGADRGLGFLINLGRGLYDIPLVFVAVFILILMALAMYTSVVLLERRVLSWRESENQA